MTNSTPAYHGSPALKDALLAQLQAHHDADEIVQGQYWENGKGCAIGCITHDRSGNHRKALDDYGGALAVYYTIDRFFEGLPNSLAKTWPIRAMSAIKPGADLSMTVPKFLLWLLRDSNIPGRDHESVAPAFQQCVAVIERWVSTGKPDRDAASAAASAAVSAARAEAAWAAAWAARAAWAEASAAAWAARAAWAAASAEAAWAAARAARAAIAAAREAASAEAAWAAEAAQPSKKHKFVEMSEKFLQLLAEAV